MAAAGDPRELAGGGDAAVQGDGGSAAPRHRGAGFSGEGIKGNKGNEGKQMITKETNKR